MTRQIGHNVTHGRKTDIVRDGDSQQTQTSDCHSPSALGKRLARKRALTVGWHTQSLEFRNTLLLQHFTSTHLAFVDPGRTRQR